MGEAELIGLIVTVVILAGIVLLQWRSNSRRARLTALQQYEEDIERSYEAAKQDYEKAHDDFTRKNNNAAVIPFIHDLGPTGEDRDETPKELYLDEAFEIMKCVRHMPENAPVIMVIHTLGGLTMASEMIASALVNHPGKVTAYVPYVAMSAGTQIALAADEIRLGEFASLGPIDSLIRGYSCQAWERLIKEKSADKISDANLLISYEVEKFRKTELERSARLINAAHGDGMAVAGVLCSGHIYHGERIDSERAKELGLAIEEGCPDEVYEMVDSRLRMLRKHDEKFILEVSGIEQRGGGTARRNRPASRY